MMDDFEKLLAEQLEDPEFKAEWDALQPELAIAQAMIDAKDAAEMAQQRLSEMTGIAQEDISKLESGNGNPTLRTLQRLAAGMGRRLRIEFLPVAQN